MLWTSRTCGTTIALFCFCFCWYYYTLMICDFICARQRNDVRKEKLFFTKWFRQSQTMFVIDSIEGEICTNFLKYKILIPIYKNHPKMGGIILLGNIFRTIKQSQRSPRGNFPHKIIWGNRYVKVSCLNLIAF
jgi:hypothetical protein